LATDTPRLAVLPASLSESVARTVIDGVAGPSANEHLKLPPLLVLLAEPATSPPPVPHEIATESTESAPGSLI
jgi:hypothetical protein